MEKARVNGLDIAYERLGGGPALVLIHGYPLDRTTWHEVGSALEKDFDLTIPDLRGLGQSDAADGTYTIADLASDLAGLLDHLQIQKAFIAGHSMGGYVALAFAGAYPGRLRGLGMISTQVAADSPERREGRYRSAAEVAARGVGVVVEAMTPKFSADPHVQSFVRALMQRQRPAGLIGSLQAMAERPDSSQVLKAFKLPVVIVHGDADELIPVERGREMKAAVPNAHYVELPRVGHMPMMDNPRAVTEALRFFLQPR
ncbi:MAG TPA: alpha/beta fold hydrolase [Anaerolineales bacterium]|nr:alpha/beta fold hydrolase [Anaerolineales bacterium]